MSNIFKWVNSYQTEIGLLWIDLKMNVIINGDFYRLGSTFSGYEIGQKDIRYYQSIIGLAFLRQTCQNPFSAS